MASSGAVEAVAGGIGSLVALLATYPLKTVYTLQAIRASESRAGRRLSTAERAALLRSPAKLLAVLAPAVAQLYSGLKPAAIESVASNAIYFYWYSRLRAGVVNHQRSGQGLPPVAAGSSAARSADIGVVASLAVAALAGAINMALTSPAQVVATRMQATASLKHSLAAQGQDSDSIRSDAVGVARGILADAGLAGFWKGFVPNLVLVVNPAVQYMAFEALSQRATAARAAAAGPGSTRVRLSPGEVFLIGAVAKIAATIVTYPVIVVKSRLQAATSHTAAELQYAGTCDCIARIARDEGVPGFFRGMQAKILQTALNAALMLMIKDQVHSSAAATVRGAQQLVGSARSLAAARRVPIRTVVSRAAAS